MSVIATVHNVGNHWQTLTLTKHKAQGTESIVMVLSKWILQNSSDDIHTNTTAAADVCGVDYVLVRTIYIYLLHLHNKLVHQSEWRDKDKRLLSLCVENCG